MRKIGFLGGAFDPVHLGHISLAQKAMEQINLDCVFLVPSYLPPHKKNALQATDRQRMEMCQTASKNMKWLKTSTIELRHQSSYTADTLHLLIREYPDVEWTLLLGEDAFCSLPNWKDFGWICSTVALATTRRWQRNKFPMKLESTVHFLQGVGASVTVLSGSPDQISSTEIRHLISGGDSPQNMMPRAVERYVIENNIYQMKTTRRRSNA